MAKNKELSEKERLVAEEEFRKKRDERERAMIQASYAVLNVPGICSTKKELRNREIIETLDRAERAAIKVWARMRKKMGLTVHSDYELDSVCDAYYAKLIGMNPEEVNPGCMGGRWLKGFALWVTYREHIRTCNILQDDDGLW